MPVPERAKAAAFVAVVVVAVVVLLAAAQALRPRVPVLTEGIRVSMVIEAPGWSILYADNSTTNNTVFAFLLEAARALHFPVRWSNWSAPYSAVFVDAIGESVNGEGGYWWVFWVNEGYGTTAADLTVLHDGDAVSWRFVEPEGG